MLVPIGALARNQYRDDPLLRAHRRPRRAEGGQAPDCPIIDPLHPGYGIGL